MTSAPKNVSTVDACAHISCISRSVSICICVCVCICICICICVRV